MTGTKIIIEIKNGLLQAVYSNTPLDYVVVDIDNLNIGKSPVLHPQQPDVLNPDLYMLYDSDTPQGLEIREELKRLKF